MSFSAGPGSTWLTKASWHDTRLDRFSEAGQLDFSEGGTIEIFDDPATQTERASYLEQFANDPPIGGWYQYVHREAIVRIGFDLTPSQAAEYEAVLLAL